MPNYPDGEITLRKGVIKEEDAKKIKEEIAALIEEAVEFAKNSPEPELDELTKDVYYEGSEIMRTIRYVEALNEALRKK